MYSRENEITKRINEAKRSLEGSPLLLETQLKIFQSAISDYFIARKKILAVAYEMLEDESKSEAEQRDQWEQHLTAKGMAALQPFKDILNRYKVILPFATLLSELYSQESIFYYKLANLQLCDVMHARLIKYRKEYNSERKSLQEKWQNIQSDNQNINTAMENIMEQFHNIYQSSIYRMGSNQDKVRKAVEGYLKLLNSLVGAVTGVSLPSEFADGITDSISILNKFMAESKTIVDRLDSLYKNEENVAVIMFGNTRKSVTEFLQNTNFDKCEAEYKNALSHAFEVAANMLTDGQKHDAKLFVTNAEKITGKRLKSFTDSYNGFVNQHREIFIGPVGDRRVWDLIRKENWDKAKKDLNVGNIQTELKKIYNDAVSWTNIDAFNFSETTKQQVKAALKKDIDRLNQGISTAIEGRSLWESLQAVLTVSKEVMFSKVKNT